MAHRNAPATETCPKCRAALTSDNGLLRCEAHGVFFSYGPHLLVRAPRLNGKGPETPMPWESRKPRAT
ncbi:MAG: hypothetical protein RLZZ387_4539 [Chloroflexota bacterium]|jgi:hypothetical protein